MALISAVAIPYTVDARITPVWELNEKSISSSQVEGDLSFNGETIQINGENSLILPGGILGEQKNYTVEFEVELPAEAKPGRVTLVSNMDTESGLELGYFPPDYNAGIFRVNGFDAVEKRGLLEASKFRKITLVVKDGAAMMFGNDSFQAITEDVKPSKLPLRFGKVEDKPSASYPVKNIKVYDQAVLPPGFDAGSVKMRNCGGDQYYMQRVEIKDPSLPRVLVVGDSISGGYRTKITSLLEGRANVDYWMQNKWHNMLQGENSPLERALSGIVSEGPYDVITFNFGLHSFTRPERSSVDTYPTLATKMVKHMKKIAPDTDWICIRTTPTSKKLEDGTRVLNPETNDRIVIFNGMTDAIMKEHGVTVVDLYGLGIENMDKFSGDGVHWTGEGYELMGKKITAAIEEKLNAKKGKAGKSPAP